MVTSPEPWRAVLTRRLTWVTVAVVAVGVVAVGTSVVRDGARWPMVAPALVLQAALLGALHPRVPWQARGWLLAFSFAVFGLSGMAMLGPLAGPGVALTVGVMLASLFLDRRAAAAFAVLVLVAMAATGWAVTHGAVAAPSVEDSSVLLPRTWLRTASIAFLSMVVLGALVAWVVAHLEGALERVRAEGEERARAEERRRQAEQAAAEAQRLEVAARLASSIAHDFNNHLAVITLYNGLLGSSPEADAEARSGISLSLEHATNLARQLLVLGRRDVRVPRAVSLQRLVSEYASTLRKVVPSDVALKVEANGPGWTVVDPVQIHQTVLNLVMNARDAMPEGGTLTVRTREVTLVEPRSAEPAPIPPGAWVVVEVEDDGLGMDAPTRARALEPFFTTKEPGRGTGLGLSTVRSIAEASGGHVALDSGPGRGTRVEVWLPAASATEALQSERPAPPEPRLDGLTVLLADDQPDLLGLLRRALIGAGARVLAANDGTESVALLVGHEGPIDLLCTDAVMPGTPIRQVLERWAQKCPGRPVLVCSGHVPEELTRRGIEEGRYALLAKPFSAAELVAAVWRLTRDAAAERDAPADGAQPTSPESPPP